MQDNFLMQVSNVGFVRKKGVAIFGTIVSGNVNIGDTIYLQTDNAERFETKVLDIIKQNKVLSWMHASEETALIVDIDKEIAQKCEYVVKMDDPAKIKNSQIYYDRIADPYLSEYKKAETFIDGKPISQQNDDEDGPVTLFDKILNKLKK